MNYEQEKCLEGIDRGLLETLSRHLLTETEEM
jgi:hypothetical protein